MKRTIPETDLIALNAATLRVSRENGVQSIALFGEIDLADVERLEHELRVAEASDAPSIVLDLSGLRFIDSSVVQAVLRAFHRCGGRLTLLRGPRSVHRVFELTALDRVLPFADG